MTVSINGEARTLDSDTTVAALVESLGLGAKRVAVEVNQRVIAKADWSDIRLADDDRIEIVQFVGGG
jgi:thiamine biosynthesis protein ThiS